MLRLAAIVALTATLSGCNGIGSGIFNPKGPVAHNDVVITLDALVIMLAIVVPTILATLAFAWWFRAGNTRARYLPDWTYSGRIEVIVWAIPILVISFLGGVIWIGSHELDPARPIDSPTPRLNVQVVSLDWKWLFIYPQQGIASVNELVVPTKTPLHFSLTSASVLNVFFVPQLGSMIYTMNGMNTRLNLQADEPGDYYGQSAMFSGDGFPHMHFTMHALAPDAFADWVAKTRRAGPALDADAYRELSKQSAGIKPFTYRSVEPGLYDAVLTQKLPPGPGPESGRPTREVREGNP